MSKLIVYQDNEKIVLVDGTTIEIDTGMFNDPLGFIVTEAVEQGLHLTGGILPSSEPLSSPKPGTGVEYLSHQPTSK